MSERAEKVDFISVEEGTDLVIAFAIPEPTPDLVRSIILQRTPKFERLLPAHDRGVVVSDERFIDDERRDLATRIVVEGAQVDIETLYREYHLDLSGVEAEEAEDALRVLRAMHRYGDFDLVIRQALA